MTPEQFEQKLRQNREALKQAIRRTIPVKMGNAAERHFKDNFRKGGFVDGSLHRWKPSKRIGKAKGAAGSYKTLLSGRNHLYNSVRHRVEPAGKGFTMPRRQFIGKSKALDGKIRKIITTTINDIL